MRCVAARFATVCLVVFLSACGGKGNQADSTGQADQVEQIGPSDVGVEQGGPTDVPGVDVVEGGPGDVPGADVAERGPADVPEVGFDQEGTPQLTADFVEQVHIEVITDDDQEGDAGGEDAPDGNGPDLCQPACDGKECGPDGCGGSCGECMNDCDPNCEGNEPYPDPDLCDQEAGVCYSLCCPDCCGKNCGDDGCGGICGQCQEEEDCVDSQCQGGACANEADKAIVLDEANQDVISDCSLGCGFGEDVDQCTADCLVENLGLSEACALCWGGTFACLVENCLDICIAEPAGDACKACFKDPCMVELSDCSGIVEF